MKVTKTELLIEPIGFCNLSCKFCYTRHTPEILPPDKIFSFIDRYINYVNLPHVRITFIGRGEITLYPHLTDIINSLSKQYAQKVSFYIQTNGILVHKVIDHLENLHNIEVSISLDGFEQANDANRGQGTFQRIVQNIKYLLNHGIPVNVQTILYPKNYRDAKKFQEYIYSLGSNVTLEFFTVLTREDVLQYEGETHLLPPISTSDAEIIEMRQALTSHEYDFIRADVVDQDVYLSVMCDGRVATCCEFQYKIGTIDSDIGTLLSKLDLKLCERCPLLPRCNSSYMKNPEKYNSMTLPFVMPVRQH